MESSRNTRSSRWWTWKDLRKCFEAFVERTEATLNVNTVFPPKNRATSSFGAKGNRFFGAHKKILADSAGENVTF